MGGFESKKQSPYQKVTKKMPGIYPQKGPRSHHFAAVVSMVIGLSIFFEYYSTNLVFSSLDGLIPSVDGQHLWGVMFFVLGILMLQPFTIMLRAVAEILACSVYTIFGLYSLYLSLLGPDAGKAGSVFGILAMAMAAVCLLATSNLKRDFYKTDKKWMKENPSADVVDPYRAKGGDSHRE